MSIPHSTAKPIKSPFNLTPLTNVKINPSLNIETYVNDAVPDSEEFLASSNSTNKVFDALNRQITKAMKRASAKLDKLNVFASGLKNKLKGVNGNEIIDDKTVERQLLFKQIDNMVKQQKHREKLEFLLINFMGLVTKNP